MNSRSVVRLGTRRSALAWIQSSQVAAALRAAHPGLEVELVGIDTRGDLIQNVPLTGIEGKEFFTAEIDAALGEGRVDFTVHSLKDLSLSRPPSLVLAATPRRANPRDIAIFANDVMERLAEGRGLTIGTSSPRRQQLLPPFFSRALPHADRNRIELVSLRGNVDTRLRRVREPPGSERRLDGIVLATAGLSRLYADTTTERQGRALLTSLLDGLRVMVLPLNEVPSAPGQGSLAIECRADDAEMRRLLSALEDPPTRAAIAFERALLAAHGGGCHQRFGATHVALPGLGGVLHVGGVDSRGEDLGSTRFLPDVAIADPPPQARAWNGSQQPPAPSRPLLEAGALASQLSGDAVFVAHSRALPEGGAAALSQRRVWTSGTASWFRLAAAGVWVEGCAEGRGADAAAIGVGEPLLRLPPPGAWSVLTHAGAEAGWQTGPWAGSQVIATYATEAATATNAPPPSTSHVWWSSIAQFDAWRGRLGPATHHACGPGKTAEHLRRSGIANLQVFPSPEAWQQWIARAAH